MRSLLLFTLCFPLRAQALAQQLGQTVNPNRLALTALEFRADTLLFVPNA